MPDHTTAIRLATLDPHAEDASSLERLAPYADCWAQAFFEGRLSDRRRELWLEASRADDVRLRAAYDEGTLRPAAAPVATFSSWTGAINVGGGRTLPLHMISDVTVEPTHRRRGLLRRMMTEDLAEAARSGLPLAALTVSEGTIYGRFGFGPATRKREVRVETASFALRQPPEALRVEVLHPEAAYDAIRAVDAAVLAQVRGSVAKPAFYEPGDRGRIDWTTGEPDRRARVAVVLDDDGTARGYARFTTRDLDGEPGGAATVHALHAVDPACALRLWQLLASLDLVRHLSAVVRVEDVLDVAVSDPRTVRTQALRDHLWLRVLDPVAALQARPWHDGSVVVEVEDPFGHAAGRFRVTAGETTAVEPTNDAVDARLDAETLGTLYLGDHTVTALAAAGRVTGPDVPRLAAMADHTGSLPWTAIGF